MQDGKILLPGLPNFGLEEAQGEVLETVKDATFNRRLPTLINSDYSHHSYFY
jgi:hypothetical protein